MKKLAPAFTLLRPHLILSLFVLSVSFSTSCNLNTELLSTESESLPEEPPTVTLSADSGLTYIKHVYNPLSNTDLALGLDESSPLVTIASPTTPAGPGVAPTGSPANISNQNLSENEDGVIGSTFPTDTSVGFSLNASSTDINSSSSCNFLSPYLALSCFYPNISLNIRDLTSNSLGVQFSVNNQTVSSNTLDLKVLTIEQISNIKNDNAVSDVVGGLDIFQNKVHFYANGLGYTKGLHRLDSASVTAVATNVAYASSSNGLNRNLAVRKDSSGNEVEVCYLGNTTSSGLKVFCYNGSTVKLISNTNGTLASQDTNVLNTSFALIDNDQKLVMNLYNSSAEKKRFIYDGVTLTQFTNTAGTGTNDIAFGDDYFYKASDNTLYFQSDITGMGIELLKYDGTNLTLVTDIPGVVNDDWSLIKKPDGSAYYLPEISTDNLFNIDAGTVLDVTTNFSHVAQPNALYRLTADYNGKVYTNAKWASDSKTYVIEVTNNSIEKLYSMPCTSEPFMTVFDSKLFFTCQNSAQVEKLLMFDGTQVTQISNTVNDNALSDEPYLPTAYANKLYFVANNDQGASKLHYYDGTEIVEVSNTVGNRFTTDYIYSAHVFNNFLYFTANTPQGGTKLFRLCDPDAGCVP